MHPLVWTLLVLLAPLANAAADVDSCNYLVTNPLAADLLRGKKACSSFQSSTLLLCPTTSTVTKTTTVTGSKVTVTSTATTATVQSSTAFATLVKTKTSTVSQTVTTTATRSITPSKATTTTTTTTAPLAPTGPIGGSQDTKRDLAEQDIEGRDLGERAACPTSYGPDVQLVYAFACNANQFRAACVKLGVTATTKTKQSTATSTVTDTVTVTPTITVKRTVTQSSVQVVTDSTTISTTVPTTATFTVTQSSTTTVSTPVQVVTQTLYPESSGFYLAARGAAYNGPISGTNTFQAGDPITLSSTFLGYYYFRIGANQALLTTFNPFLVYVNQQNVVSFSGYKDGRDPDALRCELSNPKASSGDLTCVSSSPSTSLFQTCNGDGKLYHGPGLISDRCSALQLYVTSTL